MDITIKLPYSKILCFIYTIFLITLFLFTSWSLVFGALSKKDYLPLFIFDILYLASAIFIVKHYLIPAMKGKSALELNEQGIVNNIDRYKIEWSNISAIQYEGLWSKKLIVIQLKDDKILFSQTRNIFKKFAFRINLAFTGYPIIVRTTFIKGKKSEVYKTILCYFKKINEVESLK
jgi:hypothetical protein